MFGHKREISRREEVIQKKYDMLMEDYQAVKKERDDMMEELDSCRAKLKSTEKAEEDFLKELAKAKSARIQYERAFRELSTLRASYTAEVNSLIEEMKG